VELALDRLERRATTGGDTVGSMNDRRTRHEFSEWIAVEALVLLAAIPLVLNAALGNLDNARAVVAACLIATTVLLVVLRRRGAWLALVLFYGVVVLSYAWAWTSPALFVINVVVFLLLLSPPIRRHVAGAPLRT
jgi:hypothetical protein